MSQTAWVYNGIPIYDNETSNILNDRILHFGTYIRNQETKLYQNNALVEIFCRKWLAPYLRLAVYDPPVWPGHILEPTAYA